MWIITFIIRQIETDKSGTDKCYTNGARQWASTGEVLPLQEPGSENHLTVGRNWSP